MAVFVGPTATSVDFARVAELRERYQQDRCLRFFELLEPGLARRAAHLAATLPYTSDSTRVGRRELCDEPSLRGLLMILLNRTPLFQLVEQVSGRTPVRCFEGSIYRLRAQSEHELRWHDDEPGSRLAALSLGLGSQPCEGGVFELRRKGQPRLLAAHAALRLGEALLFDVAPDLEHRVTPVSGVHPRVVLAGWFLPIPVQTLQPTNRP